MTRQPPAPGRAPNHLEGETSPYLLQHLYNPVDWHPWGSAALEKARGEDRPVFLSIGYAACHWCHVMERESFEDPRIAELLNRHFVPIKVDREERPDLDEIYMNAVQLLTGQGGWPLNVFLTPDLRPFIGGTYFPPEDRHGRPGMMTLLTRIHEDWSRRRPEIDRWAGEMTERLRAIAGGAVDRADGVRAGRDEIARAVAELTMRFDSVRGGFGAAPKFPPDGSLTLLLREHLRTGESVPLQVAETTLEQMARGGIYDHVGGGFARYSVDERWLVPHFEKMLYNQALLVPVYLDAWRILGKPLYRRVVEETLDFVYRELTDPEGGFYSSLDADSEGVEGAFYVWTPEEVRSALGEDEAQQILGLYDITSRGNFEGRNIPNLLARSLATVAAKQGIEESALAGRLRPALRKMLVAREGRPRPATDDKILTAWNGLMVTAAARAHQLLGRDEDLAAARRAADFVLSRLRTGDRLLVSYRAGTAKLNAYLDDYAFLGRGLVDLYEACFEPRYLEMAGRLARTIIDRFENADAGGFHFVSDDHESLLARTHSLHDGATPSGAGVAAELLLRLASHRGDDELRRSGLRALEACRPAIDRAPSAFASLLVAAGLADDPPPEVGIVGSPGEPATRQLLAALRGRDAVAPAVQVAPAGAAAERLPFVAGKESLEGRPTAYVCRDRTCHPPTGDPEQLARLLGRSSD